MKPEELMIGDWVCYSKANKYYTRVNEIRHTEVPLDDQWYIEGMRSDNDKINPNALEYFAVEILSPLLLTNGILEKNFSSTTDWYFIGTDKFCFRIDKYKDKWDLYFGRDGKGTNLQIKISYVHELQHALRLCGIDKEIKI